MIMYVVTYSASFFFFSSRRRHTRCLSDWSSDVCSSDLVMPLLEILEHFVEFRREVVRRRTEFELRKAEARAHILEGLKIALDHLDEVIRQIGRASCRERVRVAGRGGVVEIIDDRVDADR